VNVPEVIEVKTSSHIIVAEYPVDPILLSDADAIEYENSYATNVKAKMSGWYLQSPEIQKWQDWVVEIAMGGYSLGIMDTQRLCFYNTWINRYDVGDHTINHRHLPNLLSAVYFIKTPEGSSPLIFTESGEEVKAKEGITVIFPSHLYHHVPPNECEDRVTMSSNIQVLDENHPRYKFERSVLNIGVL